MDSSELNKCQCVAVNAGQVVSCLLDLQRYSKSYSGNSCELTGMIFLKVRYMIDKSMQVFSETMDVFFEQFLQVFLSLEVLEEMFSVIYYSLHVTIQILATCL